MAEAYLKHLEMKKASVDRTLPVPTQKWRTRAQRKEYRQQLRRWELHLEPVFAGTRRVVSSHLDEYVTLRRKEKASDATIQRELSLLQKILNHAEVQNMPVFPRLAESAPREGFVEQAAFDKLSAAIVDAGLRALVGVAYKFGFRKEELANLLVRQLDGKTLKLYAGTTKNSKARIVVLDTASLGVIAESMTGKQPNDHVFLWARGRKRGKPIVDFRTAWTNACKTAGLDGLLFHDLRRSAIRNMVRRGVPEVVARKISGHLKSSVFERYNVTSQADLEDAAGKIGQESGTISTEQQS
jgi:integrase